MRPALLDVSLQQVKAGWAERFDVDLDSLDYSGLTLIPREGSSGITALKIFDSIVAICQPGLQPILSPLYPADFLNLPLLLKCLSGHEAMPIGIASISYADSGTLQRSVEYRNSRTGSVQEAESILWACTESEQEESGVAGMPAIFIAESMTGNPGAVAGYEIWNGKIAQLGVLTAPRHRRQGLALSAAHAAAMSAIGADLIPQWRCQIGNASSYQLSQKLGFHEVGLQLAIDVIPTSS